MIPHEILKKIRQIEIRFAQISMPVFQLTRFAAGVENGQNDNAFSFDQKMNHIRKAAKNHSAPDFAANFWKPFRMVCDTLKVFFYDGAKIPAQAFPLLFIKGDGIVKFFFGDTTKNKAPLHLRYFASSLALTSLKETTSSGFLRCSCKRRSMNSASPGVNSFDSAMSSQRLRHSSICSGSGSARASFKIDSEFMESNLMAITFFASP